MNRKFVTNKYGNEYVPETPNNYTGKKAKNAQEAHEAIRPTNINRKPADVKKYVNPDQFKLYELIWSRALSSQMNPAEFDRNTINISSTNNEINFRASGSIIKFDGFLKVYEIQETEEDAKNILSEHEKKISNSKNEVKAMINKANEESEKNVIKTNEEFHNLMDNRKKNAEERVRQLKNQTIKDIKNASVKIAIESVEKLIKNSLDKSKLDKIYSSSIEETKLALKKKSS